MSKKAHSLVIILLHLTSHSIYPAPPLPALLYSQSQDYHSQLPSASLSSSSSSRSILHLRLHTKLQTPSIRSHNSEVDTLYFTLQDLKTWLSLEIPIIEDGNSFGAEVQDHLLHELDDGLRKCLNMQGSLMGHFSDRAKYGKDWCMYPGLKVSSACLGVLDLYTRYKGNATVLSACHHQVIVPAPCYS